MSPQSESEHPTFEGYRRNPPNHRSLRIVGQLGTTAAVSSDDAFESQFERALRRVLAIAAIAGGAASSIVKLTLHVSDLDALQEAHREIWKRCRRTLGTHAPIFEVFADEQELAPGALLELDAMVVLP